MEQPTVSKKKKKGGNPPSQQQPPLEKLKVAELKVLLRQKNLPVAGNKAELIARLRKYPNGVGPKLPKKWQNSDAKKALKKDLLNSMSPIHNMSVDDVWKSDPRYLLYPLFPQYLRDLKQQVGAEKKRAHLDDIAAEIHLKNNRQSWLNKRGYPHWHTHPAKGLLEVDIYNKLYKTMKPIELRMTRQEYRQFPVEIFTVRVNKEVVKQRTARFWAHKRNKEILMKYLQDVKERAHK